MSAEESKELHESILASTEKTSIGSRHLLADNIASLYVLLGLYYLIPLATLPYLVRVLGIEMYGMVAFSQSFAQYFTSLTDYGFNFSATRSIAQSKDDNVAISRIFCSVYLIKFLFGIIGFGILVLIESLIPKFHEGAAFFHLAYLAVVGNVLFPTWYFQGIQKMRYISAIVGIARLVAAGFLFLFVRHPGDALLAVGIQSAGNVVSGVIGLAMAINAFRLKLSWPSVEELKGVLKDGWHLFISCAAMGLYTNTNVFLVGVFAGYAQAGYFSAAEKLLRGTQALIGPLIQATFPHINRLRTESRELAVRFITGSLKWIGGLTLIPSVILFLFASQVTVLCFGRGTAGSIPVVRWISFLPVLSAISNVLGVNTMIPFGLDRQFSRIVIIAGVANIVLAVFLIRIFGAAGAGVSILFAEIAVVAGTIVSLWKHGFRFLSNSKMAL